MTDPIADYLTRLRNAIQAKHRVLDVPASNLKKEITENPNDFSVWFQKIIAAL